MTDVKLREIEEIDIELVRQWRNSKDVAPFMYTDSIISEEQQRNWFKIISAESSSIYWIIEYNGKKLGLASLTEINNSLCSCYWAFYIGDTSIRGAGLGAKVEYNVLQYVFTELKLNKLRCEVFVSNDRVIKMHEKFAFRREAYYKEHCIKNNNKLDVVGLAILSSEWSILSNIMKRKIYGE